MHIEHVDVPEDDPNNEAWLDPGSKDWLLGDWLSYKDKDEASQERAAQKADAITARLRQSTSRGKDSAQATVRPSSITLTTPIPAHPHERCIHMQTEAACLPASHCSQTCPTLLASGGITCATTRIGGAGDEEAREYKSGPGYEGG